MRIASSLKNRITILAGGLFLLLYFFAFLLVLGIDARNGRRDLQISLYAQSESMATYYASSGRLDYPELLEFHQDAAIPIWLRLSSDGDVLAATPGAPEIPVPGAGDVVSSEVTNLEDARGSRFAVVSHEVWNSPGTVVSAIATVGVLAERRRALAYQLVALGVFLVPLAALGGRLVASRALRPIDSLIASTRAIDSDQLDHRIEAPEAVTEVAQIAEEFNRLLDRLDDSMTAMRRFTADASHELRTPISTLRAGLEIALRKERSGDQYRVVLAENLVEIERVQRVVESLLTLAKAEAGQSAARQESTVVELSPLLKQAADSMRALAAEKDIEIVSEIAPNVEVHGNADYLRLMITNLLDNAIKFTSVGTQVHLRLDTDSEGVLIEVQDQGIGIPFEEREKVFDRFFRGGRARASGSGPGGIGLNLVKWVAENHGGNVGLVDLETPGATFEVRLPRVG